MKKDEEDGEKEQQGNHIVDEEGEEEGKHDIE
jgi:hypothetical protein